MSLLDTIKQDIKDHEDGSLKGQVEIEKQKAADTFMAEIKRFHHATGYVITGIDVQSHSRIDTGTVGCPVNVVVTGIKLELA